jgi:hypothetical protein
VWGRVVVGVPYFVGAYEMGKGTYQFIQTVTIPTLGGRRP